MPPPFSFDTCCSSFISRGEDLASWFSGLINDPSRPYHLDVPHVISTRISTLPLGASFICLHMDTTTSSSSRLRLLTELFDTPLSPPPSGAYPGPYYAFACFVLFCMLSSHPCLWHISADRRVTGHMRCYIISSLAKNLHVWFLGNGEGKEVHLRGVWPEGLAFSPYTTNGDYCFIGFSCMI